MESLTEAAYNVIAEQSQGMSLNEAKFHVAKTTRMILKAFRKKRHLERTAESQRFAKFVHELYNAALKLGIDRKDLI